MLEPLICTHAHIRNACKLDHACQCAMNICVVHVVQTHFNHECCAHGND
jgi:hypothetical protein